jgi:SET domain-containing protein
MSIPDRWKHTFTPSTSSILLSADRAKWLAGGKLTPVSFPSSESWEWHRSAKLFPFGSLSSTTPASPQALWHRRSRRAAATS